ncbi:hypothetical protein [Rheinheimera gaetbuli]
MSGIIKNPQFVAIAIKVPEGVEMQLGCEIEVQGHKVGCQSINWGTNSCMEAAALEQHLDAALEVLENAGHGYMDYYLEKLEELREANDLIELEKD